MKRFLIGTGLGLVILFCMVVMIDYLQHDKQTLPLQVQVYSPLDSAIIYSDSLNILGTTTQPITLQADLWVDDKLISSHREDFPVGEWSSSFHHAYEGDPTEANLRIVNSETGVVYQEAVILLSQPSERPEGEFFRVVAPSVGMDIGGDYVVVQGRVSGFIDEVVTVQLLDDRQSILDQQTITVHNLNRIDDMPFRVELKINQWIGMAIVLVKFEQAGHEEIVPINLVRAAG